MSNSDFFNSQCAVFQFGVKKENVPFRVELIENSFLGSKCKTWKLAVYDAEGYCVESFTGDVPEDIPQEYVEEKLTELVNVIASQATLKDSVASFYAAGNLFDIEQDSFDNITFKHIGSAYYSSDYKTIVRQGDNMFEISLTSGFDEDYLKRLCSIVEKANSSGFLRRILLKTYAGIYALFNVHRRDDEVMYYTNIRCDGFY